MTARRSIGRARGGLYTAARLLGDLSALMSGSPKRIGKRAANKLVGRTIVRRLWWR